MIIQGKYNQALVTTSCIEEEAIQQIKRLCDQKWNQGNNIVIMPDVHAGKGCTIGTTITLKSPRICPNLVGVDIGCGMLFVKIPTHIKLDLKKIDEAIHERIPYGFKIHSKVTKEAKAFQAELSQLHCLPYIKSMSYLLQSLGTLGGGNHFIEINEYEDEHYLVIHSGSRHLGLEVAQYYQQKAIQYCLKKKMIQEEKRKLIEVYKKENKQAMIQEGLKSIDEKYVNYEGIVDELCFIEGQDALDYFDDMRIATKYASLNRQIMARIIMKDVLGIEDYTIHETIHNYIDFSNEYPVLRKGAISAKKDERVLIPINMRDGSIIALGKGNQLYNQSGPHGAGRLMSRKQAKETIQLEDFKDSMKGIYTTSLNESTLDESPFAYKSIDTILTGIQDLVTVEKIIKPIYNFKAHD